MALAFYFAPQAMTAQRYDECIAQLKKAGAANPPGRLYHSCFGTPENVMVFDVWTSQAAFDKFGQTLMPILQGLGVDPGQPSVMEVHNTIVPPVAKPKATPAKPAAKPAAKATAKRAAKPAAKPKKAAKAAKSAKKKGKKR